MEKTESQGRRRTQKAKGETSQKKGNQVRIHEIKLGYNFVAYSIKSRILSLMN